MYILLITYFLSETSEIDELPEQSVLAFIVLVIIFLYGYIKFDPLKMILLKCYKTYLMTIQKYNKN